MSNNQPNLQDIIMNGTERKMSNDFPELRLKPEAIDAIYAAGLSAIGDQLIIDDGSSEAFIEGRKYQQFIAKKAWKQWCYGEENSRDESCEHIVLCNYEGFSGLMKCVLPTGHTEEHSTRKEPTE